MAKIDITLSRSMTINVGNYNAIKPSVGLTIHDIESSKAKEVYDGISEVMDALLAKETLKLTDEYEAIAQLGIKTYVSELRNQERNIDGTIKSFPTR